MHHALSDALELYNSAVLIGSDCGLLTTEILDRAFASLHYAETTVGPAMDGGYYLVGANQPIPGVFEDIDWSTDQVLHQTLTRLLDDNMNFALGPTLRDVDTIDDWDALLALDPSFG
jgi:glycosyltransferase A (GT-A) superfamily protein (DUF2064 family)